MEAQLLLHPSPFRLCPLFLSPYRYDYFAGVEYSIHRQLGHDFDYVSLMA